MAAVLSDEAVVVEGVGPAFLTLLSEATNWTHHASIREGLMDLVPSLKLVNGSADARWGLPDGRLPIARHAQGCAIANP